MNTKNVSFAGKIKCLNIDWKKVMEETEQHQHFVILNELQFCKTELKRLREDVEILKGSKRRRCGKRNQTQSETFHINNNNYVFFVHQYKRIPDINRNDEKDFAEWFNFTLENEKSLTREQLDLFLFTKGLAEGVMLSYVSVDDLFGPLGVFDTNLETFVQESLKDNVHQSLPTQPSTQTSPLTSDYLSDTSCNIKLETTQVG